MRIGVCAIIFVFATGASAQVIPIGLQESIDNLRVEISALSSSTNNIYNLGNANLPAAQDSLAKAADALQVLGNFSTTAQNNVTPIAFGAIGVIAAGIVLGQGIFFGIKYAVKAVRARYILQRAAE